MMIGRPVSARNTGESPIDPSSTAFVGVLSTSHVTIGRYSAGVGCSRFNGRKLSVTNCHTAALNMTSFHHALRVSSPTTSTGTANPKKINDRTAIHASRTSNIVNTINTFVGAAPFLRLDNSSTAITPSGPHHFKLRQNSGKSAVLNAPPSHSTRASHGSSAGFAGRRPRNRNL